MTLKERILQEMVIDSELEELLEIRKILSKIYKDKTVFLKEPKKLNHPVLVVDLSKYPLIWCDKCGEDVTFEATGTERWIYITCDFCDAELLHLEGNHQ